MSETSGKNPSRIGLLLVILPLWLLLSAGGAVWYFLHQEKNKAMEDQERFSRVVSATSLADDVRKLVDLVGERNTSSESAGKNLTRAAAMIEGSLGPSNIGFAVKRASGPAVWPLLHVSILGADPAASALWVVCAYDSRPGSPGVESNATGVAAMLAAAQALAGEKPTYRVHFAFIPHGSDPDSPVVECVAKLAQMIGKPHAVLCVESMGGGEALWLSSRDTSALPLGEIVGLGEVKGAEVVCMGDDVDLASVLFEIGLPAVRVATRPLVGSTEKDETMPTASTLAGSTGRLVELIRRCASRR